MTFRFDPTFPLIGSFLDWTANVLSSWSMLIGLLICAIFVCCFRRRLIDGNIMRLSRQVQRCFWHIDWHLKGSFHFKRIDETSNNKCDEIRAPHRKLTRELFGFCVNRTWVKLDWRFTMQNLVAKLAFSCYMSQHRSDWALLPKPTSDVTSPERHNISPNCLIQLQSDNHDVFIKLPTATSLEELGILQ